MIETGILVKKPIIVEPREMKSAIKALDEALNSWSTSVAHRLTLDIDSLRDQIPDVIFFSTASFWGIWKNITRKEIVWTLNRSQAVRLKAALEYRVEGRNTALVVTEGWFTHAPMFYKLKAGSNEHVQNKRSS